LLGSRDNSVEYWSAPHPFWGDPVKWSTATGLEIQKITQFVRNIGFFSKVSWEVPGGSLRSYPSLVEIQSNGVPGVPDEVET